MAREALTVAVLCLAWYAASSASNVVGKLVLTDFPFPLTVTMVQLLSTVLYSAPAFAACGVRRQADFSRGFYWRVLVPLAFAKFLTTVFSQISLWKVPVSYAHTVKATTPLWTAALGRLALGERVSARVAGALLLIAAGVAVASATELQFDGAGLAAALAAAALLAAQHLAAKRVLRSTGAHHLRLLQALAPPAALLLAPAWAALEAPSLAAGAAPRGGWPAGGALLAADGALAWLQAVAAFSVLSRVSPLAYAVASAAKRAVIVAASLLLLRNPASAANLAGMALAAAGVLLYNRAKHAERAAPGDRAPLLPV